GARGSPAGSGHGQLRERPQPRADRGDPSLRHPASQRGQGAGAQVSGVGSWNRRDPVCWSSSGAAAQGTTEKTMAYMSYAAPPPALTPRHSLTIGIPTGTLPALSSGSPNEQSSDPSDRTHPRNDPARRTRRRSARRGGAARAAAGHVAHTGAPGAAGARAGGPARGARDS